MTTALVARFAHRAMASAGRATAAAAAAVTLRSSSGLQRLRQHRALSSTAASGSSGASPSVPVTPAASSSDAASAAPAASATATGAAAASAASVHPGGTAVVMLNMGGPASVPEVGPFLDRLFSDGEIIQLGPLQKWLGPLISKRRTPKIEAQYAQIGGSPIRKWTEQQGAEMCKRLDKLSPQTAPHKVKGNSSNREGNSGRRGAASARFVRWPLESFFSAD